MSCTITAQITRIKAILSGNAHDAAVVSVDAAGGDVSVAATRSYDDTWTYISDAESAVDDSDGDVSNDDMDR